jgi:hypothetical protein
MSRAIRSTTPTVADELVFNSLDPQIRCTIERLYGGPPHLEAGTPSELAEMYLRGLEDAVDEMSVLTPHCSKADALRAVTTILATKRRDERAVA